MNLDNPGILINLNGHLNKKTCIILLSVSKIMKEYIILKDYTQLVKKLNFSELNLIKIIITSDLDVNFLQVMEKFKIFKYTIKSKKIQFHNWRQKHWDLVTTFIIYRYIIKEYEYNFIEDDEPFMYHYRGYIKNKIIEFIYCNFEKCDLNFIYNVVKKIGGNQNHRELIMI